GPGLGREPARRPGLQLGRPGNGGGALHASAGVRPLVRPGPGGAGEGRRGPGPPGHRHRRLPERGHRVPAAGVRDRAHRPGDGDRAPGRRGSPDGAAPRRGAAVPGQRGEHGPGGGPVRRGSRRRPGPRAGRGPGRVGPATEHRGGRRPGLGAVREQSLPGGPGVREAGPAPGHEERAVPIPPGDDRKGSGPDRRGPPGRPGGPRREPALLDPVVGLGGPDTGLAEGVEVTKRRRAIGILLVGMAAFAVPGLIAAPPASAHPLGNFTVNRYSGLLLSPGRFQLTYVLDMAEIPTFQETPNIDTNGDGTITPQERQSCADRTAPDLLRGLSLTAGGRPVDLSASSDSMRFRQGQGGLPILYFTAVFSGLIPSAGDLRYEDRNYLDRIGWKEISAASADGVASSGSNVPIASVSHELLAYPVSLLSSPLHVTPASLSFRPGHGSGVGSVPEADGGSVDGSPVSSGKSFAALVSWRLTPMVLAVSLLLAFAFGALHALGPGHGKTITAAYLV